MLTLVLLLSSLVSAKPVLVAGNWKANGSLQTTAALVSQVLNEVQVSAEEVEVVVGPAFSHLDSVIRTMRKGFAVAAQTCSQYPQGAYTGEVPAEMLREMGVEWVILGHSERRQLSGETNEVVSAKLERALGRGLQAILCVGETHNNPDTAKAVILSQLSPILPLVFDWRKVVIAYEPVWAIGTGQAATLDHIASMHKTIREIVWGKTGERYAQGLRVVYGGSVSEKNCRELLRLEEVDGVLVGGAALTPGFRLIIEAAGEIYREKKAKGEKLTL